MGETVEGRAHDGSFLVTASRDKTVRTWEVADRSELHRYDDYPFDQLSVAERLPNGSTCWNMGSPGESWE